MLGVGVHGRLEGGGGQGAGHPLQKIGANGQVQQITNVVLACKILTNILVRRSDSLKFS